MSTFTSDVPAWDGNPSTYLAFEVACRWYEKTLKENERRGAAARVWSKLSGPARSVVKHLSPEDFDTANGLDKLLEVLRSSPLQSLPIPDSFSKLERWHQLKRRDQETIPELLVREDELFLELQQSLLRSRARDKPVLIKAPVEPGPEGAASPGASPSSAKKEEKDDDGEKAAESPTTPIPVVPRDGIKTLDFFDNELRGFRLLKAAGVSHSERQQVLTLTGNSVAFEKIRQALRALFDDTDPSSRRPKQRIYWEDYEDSPHNYFDDDVTAYWAAWPGYESYWASGGDGWDEPEWEDAWPDDDPAWQEESYVAEADQSEIAEDEESLVNQEKEASILAAEANRTLAEARAAIQKVRSARGYFPLGGKTGSKGHSPSMKGKDKGKKGFGKAGGKSSKGKGCILCGRTGHYFRDCPGRLAKGKPGKGPSKGSGSFWVEPYHQIYFCGAGEEAEYADDDQAGPPDYPTPDNEDLAARSDGTIMPFESFAGPFDGTIRPFESSTGPLDVAIQPYDNAEVSCGSTRQEVIPLFVMSVDTLYHTMSSGSPGFVLDTGATETAIGVQTLHDLLQVTRLKYTVDTSERPVFRFGDGMSLRAASKVTLHGTSLGAVSFFVLDGDHRPQTRNASSTPALIGSRYFRDRRATISYEHMSLWFLDSANSLWGTDLLQTQSGHLLVPVDNDIMNITALRSKTEETYGVVLPPDAPSLIDLLSTPGAVKELKKIQDRRVENKGAVLAASASASGDQVSASDQGGSSSAILVGNTSGSCDPVLRPSLVQRLRSLRLRLGCLALNRDTSAPLHVELQASRSLGRSSGIGLAVQGPPQSERNPPESVCGLRLSYDKKKGGHGYSRTAGPPAAHVETALEELRMAMHAEELTESIVKGKIMEVQGRKMTRGEKVRVQTLMEEREPSPSPPTCDSRRRQGVKKETGGPTTAPAMASLRPKTGAKPPLTIPSEATSSEKPKDEHFKEIQEAWMTIRDQEDRLLLLKTRLQEELVANGKDPEKEFNKMSWMGHGKSSHMIGKGGLESHSGAEDRDNEAGITYELRSPKTGHLIDRKETAIRVVSEIVQKEPFMVWLAPAARPSKPCDPLESPGQWRNRQRAQRRALEVAESLAEAGCQQLRAGREFVWEWPLSATYGRDCAALRNLTAAATETGKKLCDFVIEGCADHEDRSAHGKRWRIITTSRQVAASLRRCRCPGHKEHPDDPGPVRLPHRLREAALDGVRWEMQGDDNDIREDLRCLSTGEERAYALSREGTAMPLDKPSGKRLAMVRDLMMRIHRASGHASFSNLAKLLERRGSPKWAVEMAAEMTCPDCAETRRPPGAPVASADEPASLWEVLGADVFEYEFVKDGKPFKCKALLMVDRASRYASTYVFREFPSDESWEPDTSEIKKAIVAGWLAHNPAPKWLFTDAAPYFTSREMLDFVGRSGIGLLTAPAEAHWLLGVEERTIQIIKRAADKIDKEDLGLGVSELLSLACHGHNSHIHSATGYSPFQWARGWQREDSVPVGLDPKRAFSRTLLLRAKAETAFARADAAEKLSRLNNTVQRPTAKYDPGSLVMLWRVRAKAGRGAWTGPLRVLLQEGTTLWLATGSTMVKAKTNQVRKCTERETLVVSTQGAVVHRTAVGLDILLRGYRGKHFLDATQENPGQDLLEDLGPADVQAEPPHQEDAPQGRGERDVWEIRDSMLIRKHRVPRLTLFTPVRIKDLPVLEDHLSGRRRTVLQSPGGGNVIEDNYKTDPKPARSMMDRWRGETQFEILPEHCAKYLPARDPDLARRPEESARKAPRLQGPEASSSSSPPPLPEHDPLEDLPVPASQSGIAAEIGDDEPPVPDTPVPPEFSRGERSGNAPLFRGGSEQQLPEQPEFLEEEHASAAPYSTSEESSDEELLPDGDGMKGISFVEDVPSHAAYACEMEMTDQDLKRVRKRPRKAAVWLSQKMSEKSREVSWRSLTEEEKREYDEAQAVEVTNVVREAAIRALSAQELQDVDMKNVMAMRWVLTRKQSGKAKARLVVLGYQAHNLTSVETSAPTLSRTGRNVLLATAANHHFTLESGDVTSAFLQTMKSLESENLLVFAPVELAVMFGADPKDAGMIMKLTKAFYGLVHAPRRWHEAVVEALTRSGWKQLKSDRCIFALYSPDGSLVGIAGVHVDDFLIAGLESSEIYKRAKQDLQNTFRFGKWDSAKGPGFDFAGCHVWQDERGIHMNQEEYVRDWIQEIPLSSTRAQQLNSPATPHEISELRGALGTLSWKASQTGPQFQAAISLKLSEIPFASVRTIVEVNKLVREVRKTAKQRITFPAWNYPWQDIATVVWADASQGNRPNKSSTVGLMACLGPSEIKDGSEVPLAMISWRSSKAPRESLGSNGSEVQALTVGEDTVFLIRAMWLEVHGIELHRDTLHETVRDNSIGILVTDSKGIYDAFTRNVSSLHGLRSSRAGFELTVAVQQAMQLQTHLRWVNGEAQLADGLTKDTATARKGLLSFLANGQRWSVVYDPKFTAAKKVRKTDLQKALKEREEAFIASVRAFSKQERYPWYLDDIVEVYEDLHPENLRKMLAM
ncbi:GIP [Symbiodinium sp. CCMP2592]|nr:GIP [Symbiodinium sp. CCMP2592]